MTSAKTEMALINHLPGGALINHLPDELLAEVFCFVDAKTLFVAVPSVSQVVFRSVVGGRREGSYPG